MGCRLGAVVRIDHSGMNAEVGRRFDAAGDLQVRENVVSHATGEILVRRETSVDAQRGLIVQKEETRYIVVERRAPIVS